MRHPNIVLFMGASRVGNDLFIVTEYVERGSLRGVLKTQNVEISWIKRGKIALDIACASTFFFSNLRFTFQFNLSTFHQVAYLHARKIIFRDLKSKNILVKEIYK